MKISEKLLQKYRQFVETSHPDTLSFEFSVGYIRQAARNGIWADEKKKSILVHTTKQKEGNSVILACAGEKRSEHITAVAQNLHEQSALPVIIKNVDKDLELALLQAGCRHYRADEWWDPWFKYDDNTFPEQILDTAAMVQLAGRKFQKLRNEVNVFQRNYRYHISTSKRFDQKKINTLAHRWAKNLNERNFVGEKFLIESIAMYLIPHTELMQYEIVDTEKKVLIGALAFSKISPRCLAANLLLNDFSYRNSSRICMLEGARITHKLGYQFLNAQGSEDTNQHLAKRMLKPAQQVFKTHLIYDGNRY